MNKLFLSLFALAFGAGAMDAPKNQGGVHIKATLLVYEPNARELMVIQNEEGNGYTIPTFDIPADIVTPRHICEQIEDLHKLTLNYKDLELVAELKQSYTKAPKTIIGKTFNSLRSLLFMSHIDEKKEKTQFQEKNGSESILFQCYYIPCFKPYPLRGKNLVFKSLDKIIENEDERYQPLLVTKLLNIGPALKNGELNEKKITNLLKLDTFKGCESRIEIYPPISFLLFIEQTDPKFKNLKEKLKKEGDKKNEDFKAIGDGLMIMAGLAFLPIYAEKQCVIL